MGHAVEMIDGKGRDGRARHQRGQPRAEQQQPALAQAPPRGAHIAEFVALAPRHPFIERHQPHNRREGHLEARVEQGFGRHDEDGEGGE